MKSISPADHLRVPRHHGLFLHHGIDLGDGTVAHYLEGREILRSSIEEFRKGENITVITHPSPSKSSVTLRRAKSRIGEKRYNLLFNNCEHFANWCKTGKHRSQQMENFLHQSSLGAIAIGQVLPAAFFSGLRLLLAEGLTNKTSYKKAQEFLRTISIMRVNLLKVFESTLEKVECYMQENYEKTRKGKHSSRTRNLLLRSQNIEDQLTALEDLEEKIHDFLKASKAQA